MLRKKPKVDFTAIRTAAQTRIASINSLENEVKRLKEEFRIKCPKDSAHLHRFFDTCSCDTLEIMLVCRLGLDGVECLRSALKLIPDSFLEKKAQFACAIVNEVLVDNDKEALEENECRYQV